MQGNLPVRFGPEVAGKGPAPRAPRRRPTGVPAPVHHLVPHPLAPERGVVGPVHHDRPGHRRAVHRAQRFLPFTRPASVDHPQAHHAHISALAGRATRARIRLTVIPRATGRGYAGGTTAGGSRIGAVFPMSFDPPQSLAMAAPLPGRSGFRFLSTPVPAGELALPCGRVTAGGKPADPKRDCDVPRH